MFPLRHCLLLFYSNRNEISPLTGASAFVEDIQIFVTALSNEEEIGIEGSPMHRRLIVTNSFIFFVQQFSGVFLFGSIFPDLGGLLVVRL